jgi:TolB protein
MSQRAHIVAMKQMRTCRRRLAITALFVLILGLACGTETRQPEPELNILFQVKLKNQYDVLCLKTEGIYPDSVAVLPGNAVTPVWSPDHTKFVFSHERNNHFDVAVADADGSNLHYLTSDTADNFNIASWFPSGDSLVFATNRDGNLDIYSIHADGTGLRPVATDQANEWHPIITPDRKRMLFLSDRTGRPRIWALDFAGKYRRMIFKPDTLTADFEPAISPDGRYLVYSRVVRGDDPNNFNIVVYDLVKDVADLIIIDPATDRYPRFSPDGLKILFHSNRTGTNALHVYDRATKTTRALNTGAANSAYGDW